MAPARSRKTLYMPAGRVGRPQTARQIDVPVNRVTAILNGQRGITADTALRLGHWFGTSPEFWLNLQNLFELRLARADVGKRVEKLPALTTYKPRDRGAPAPLKGSVSR
ncbi:MAG: HigA family addiction module antitoxin [Beijerinckiaceae bacterium]